MVQGFAAPTSLSLPEALYSGPESASSKEHRGDQEAFPSSDGL